MQIITNCHLISLLLLSSYGAVGRGALGQCVSCICFAFSPLVGDRKGRFAVSLRETTQREQQRERARMQKLCVWTLPLGIKHLSSVLSSVGSSDHAELRPPQSSRDQEQLLLMVWCSLPCWPQYPTTLSSGTRDINERITLCGR